VRIHAKLVSFVAGALVVPFVLGIFYVRHFGRLYYLKQQGIVHLMIAEELAGTLESGVRQKFEQVISWVVASPLHSLAAAESAPSLSMEQVQQIDSQWSASGRTNEVQQAILSNPLSAYMRAFQRVNPGLAEMQMTDRYGRLIGATGPTTDYWQADEDWWTTASTLPSGDGKTEGLLCDKSAGVLVIEMAFPVYSLESSADFIGVLKVSLHATRFLQQVAPRPWNKEIARDLVLPDGRMVARINPRDTSEFPRLPREVIRELLTAADEWKAVELHPGILSLAAAVPVHILDGAAPGSDEAGSPCQLYALVSRELDEAMMPVQIILRHLTVWGLITALLVAVLSYLLATYWFARPIKKLRNAAVSLVEYIKLSEQGRFEDSWESQQEARRQLGELKTIRGRDELEDLSRDFIRMAERMLGFLRRIEQKLNEVKRK
jgi:HAMP domain-containing protein